MTTYPRVPELPASRRVDPGATPAPLGDVLYFVDADTQLFVSPYTLRPPLMAQALPLIRLNAVTVFRVQLFSQGVPVTPDNTATVVFRISDALYKPVYESQVELLSSGEYRVTVDFVNTLWKGDTGSAHLELSIDRRVVLADKCVLGAALWPFTVPAGQEVANVVNVMGGAINLTPTKSIFQLPPVPEDATSLHLIVTGTGGTSLNKLLFYSTAPALTLSTDGATLVGNYTGPGWYCSYIKEANGVALIEIQQMTDFDEGRELTVRGFEVSIVYGDWPTYGRVGVIYIDNQSHYTKIWKDGRWFEFSAQNGVTPYIDPVTKTWIVGETDTEIVAEAADARIRTIDLNVNDAEEDHLDNDEDGDTLYRMDIQGYILNVSAYADAESPFPDRYNTKVTYDGTTNYSSIWLSEGEYNFILTLPVDRQVLRVDRIEKSMVDGVPTDLSDLADSTGLFTAKEDVANKATDFTAPDDTTYPTTLAVATLIGDIDSILDALNGEQP